MITAMLTPVLPAPALTMGSGQLLPLQGGSVGMIVGIVSRFVGLVTVAGGQSWPVQVMDRKSVKVFVTEVMDRKSVKVFVTVAVSLSQP